ncbi:Protein CBR-SRE-38, partial [Caenorhabditis briggsae]
IIRLKSTNSTFWLPIYIMNDTSFQSGPYLVLLIAELILYIATGVVICSTVRIFLKIKLFHRNMNIMKMLFLCQWFEAILAKLIIIPYQIGYIKLTDSPQPFVSWWSDDNAEIIVIEKASPIVYPLIIASFLVWHYAYSMIFGILNLGIERIFASVMLKDYENTRRLWIPITLLCSTHIITGVFSYLVLINYTGFYIGTSPCFVNSGLTFLMYIIVLKVNKTRRKKLECPGCDYSLAQQFQIKENYRALKLAKNLLIVVLCAMSVPCALLILLVIGLIPSFKMILIHIMENSIYLNPIIICTVLMFSSTVWRDEYLKLIPGWKRFRKVGMFIVRPRPHVAPGTSTTPPDPDEGLVYFEQLKKSW